MHNSKGIFRQVALERISSPERLDQLMRVTSPRAWMFLLAIAALLALALVWAIFSTITTSINGDGTLIASANGSMEAQVYISVEAAQSIQVGMEAQVSPINLRPQEYGYLLGEVSFVASRLTTVNDTPMIEVRVSLRKNETSTSGYTWTTGEGPANPLIAGTPCLITITVDKEHPVSRLLPILGD